MKKLIMSLAVIAACRSTTTTMTTVAPAGAPGASDPTSAVRGFMAAAKEQDIQAMGAIWGDANGPARSSISQDELAKRELIMMCHLRHDRYDVVGDAPTPEGGRAMAVNLTYGPITRATSVEVVRGPSNRWYVKQVDINKLQDICARKSAEDKR